MRTYEPPETVSRELYPYCQCKYMQIIGLCDRFPKKMTYISLYCMNIIVFVVDIRICMYIINITTMSQNKHDDSKQAALRASGTLHPKPDTVRDDAFTHGDFFDPNDLVQVKYEMLRRHREEHKSVTEVARLFGTSRQAFYTAKALFDTQGIPGLIPKRRGPRGAHKCTEEVLDFAEQWKENHPAERGLTEAIEQHFGIHIHPRTVERVLLQRKKKRPPETET